MKHINWNEVEEVSMDYKKLVAGGYVCIITNVEDVPKKEYLKIEYDIAKGEFENHFQKLFEAKEFWGGKFIKSYKDGKAQSFFKAFLTALNRSNGGFIYNNDEKALVGKLVGLVLAEEEYIKNDQTIGTRLFVHSIRSIEQINAGEFNIPEIKRIEPQSNTQNPFGGQVLPNEDIPW
ncbi:MAG: hypothetical protein H6Q71_1473 [Firmicutes bacterium]|nr:hypothetical protein [Bacillota bacterium]